jgi:GNAT superfamily N-acetyltransferase
MVPADWTRPGLPPDIDVALERVAAPTAAFYRDLYDRVGRPWLWYERRLLSDAVLSALLAQPGHELHVARNDGALVGYFELADDELVFFGLTLAYVGRRIGPWLLDRAAEAHRALADRTFRSIRAWDRQAPLRAEIKRSTDRTSRRE